MTYDDIWKDPNEHFLGTLSEQAKESLKSCRKILDLGCGDGRIAVMLAEEGHEVTAMDLSEVGIAKTQERALQAGKEITCVLGDIFFPLPFESTYFDAVISLQSLNHSTRDKIQETLKEIERVLKPGGMFMIMMAAWETYALEKETDMVYRDTEYGTKYAFFEPQTYMPMEGDEKGLVHFAYTREQLEKDLKHFSNVKIHLHQKHHMATGRR